jgi:hypothetical protein
MKLVELVLNLKYLTEHIRKVGNRYFIFSHRTNKRIGKKAGYPSKGAAASSMFMLASRGGFSKNKHKGSVIKKYLARHRSSK